MGKQKCISKVAIRLKPIAQYLLAIILLQACSSSKYLPQQKIPPQQLQKDVVVLRKVLEQNHPGLYWYSSKATIDSAFTVLYAATHDSLTELTFHNKIAQTVSTIQCGHTAVRFSKSYIHNLMNNRFPMFPLYLYNWENRLFVFKNMYVNDTIIKKGMEITFINQFSAQQIIDSLFQFISADANNPYFKSQIVSNNFPAWYKLVFGLDSIYHIQFIDKNGIKKETILRNYTPVKDSLSVIAKIKNKAYPLPSKKISAIQLKRSFRVDSTLLFAYMHVSSFSGGRLRTFFKRSFRTLHQEKIPNLIVDVRGNGGGNVNKFVLLTKYLKLGTFKVADTAVSLHKTMWDKPYIIPWWLYWFPMQFGSVKGMDGLFHAKRIERHVFHPKNKNHYNGAIYLLQDGYTFSAAAMFTGQLKNQKNVLIVGTPSGGAYYGNNALFLPHIQLPESKLRITLPMYRVVLSSERQKNGEGVLPDIWVKPNQQQFITLPPNALQQTILRIIKNK